MRKLIYQSIAVLTFMGFNLSAQSDSAKTVRATTNISTKFDREQSKASIAIYRHLDKLQKNSRVKNELEEYNFIQLFESNESKIVNEILPANNINDPVNVDGYLDNSLTYYLGGTMNTYKFHPYRMTISASNAQEYIFQVDVVKEIGMLSYENIFFRDQMDLRYELVYNRQSEEVKIRSISLNQERGHFLRLDFPPELQENKDLDILVNGEVVKRNLDNGILLSDLKDGEQLNIEPSSDELLGGFSETMRKESFGPNALYNDEPLKFNFRPKRFYLDLVYQTATSAVSESSVDMAGTGLDATVAHRQRETVFGLNLGYRLLNVSDKFFMSLELGLQQRAVNLGASSERMFSSFEDVIPQFNTVDRYTQSTFISESADLSVMSAGLGLNFRFKLHRLAHLEVGGAYNMGISQSGTYESAAISDYYFIWRQANLRIYGDNPEYGTAVNENSTGSDDLNVDSYSNIQLQSTLSFRISKRFWLELGVNYGMNNWTFSPADENILSRSAQAGESAMESLNHLTGTLGSLNAIGYQLGIKYYL